MATFKIGTTFARNSQWHQDEINLVANIESQINRMFPTGNNLLINTTWFGPQFDNGEYIKLSKKPILLFMLQNSGHSNITANTFKEKTC